MFASVVVCDDPGSLRLSTHRGQNLEIQVPGIYYVIIEYNEEA